MNEDRLRAARHTNIRTLLQVGGPIVACLGLVFMLVGFGSFFAAFGSVGNGFEMPRYFWCVFVGMPLLFVGGSMCMFGYLGSFQRYIAGESAPVAKDVINYMGENIQPGVKAMVKAVAEGVFEAQREQQPKPGNPA